MKVKVLRTFYDKFNLTRVFTPGEVVDFEEERAKDIVNRGLGQYFKEEVKPEPKKEEEAPEPEKVEQPAIFNEEPKEEVEVPTEVKKRGRKRKTE